MEEIVRSAVKKHEGLILEVERHVWKNPETGYREWKTTEYLAGIFRDLGYTLTMAGNIPGFYTDIDTGRPGPKILVLGELDSLICEEHPESDPETHAVHSCGHNAQCAALAGVAAALREEEVLDGLSGSVRLCAVPAEEGIEIQYRQQLKEDGVIRYGGGKVEFLHRGYFDGVDMAFMIHTTNEARAKVNLGSVGVLRKIVRYIGVSAHAGGYPEEGINALYAATLGLSAINALRETFKESDLVRVHPIITKGGDAVNAIPADVILESYVRGKTLDVIEKENKKVTRALVGAAVSMGAQIAIQDMSGGHPLKNDEHLRKIAFEAMEGVLGRENVVLNDVYSTGSTDMGDLSAVMPAVHPYMPGASGNSHGSDYFITDPQRACVDSACVQVSMLRLLMKDKAERAKTVLADFKSPYASKEEYFRRIDAMESDGERVEYTEDGEIRIPSL